MIKRYHVTATWRQSWYCDCPTCDKLHTLDTPIDELHDWSLLPSLKRRLRNRYPGELFDLVIEEVTQ